MEILNRYTNAVIYKCDCTEMRAAILQAVSEHVALIGANLGGADLRDACLRGADLRGANLRNANLGGANLRDANLRDANLGGADLRDADLGGADLRGARLRDADLGGADLRDARLRGADLRDARLRGADLRGANLRNANLGGADLRDDTYLPTGETFETYKSEVLPALCMAGGKTLAEVAATWTCHDWSNCPMHTAFDFDGGYRASTPPLVKLLKPRIDQFVQLYDAGLLPNPCPETPAACELVEHANTAPENGQ